MTIDVLGRDLADKLQIAEKAISSEYGLFVLFALAEREEAPGRWDLLVSAPWLEMGAKGIQKIIQALQPYLVSEDWLKFASITPLPVSMDYVQWIARKYDVQHDNQEVANVFWNGLLIPHGFVITADLSADLSVSPAAPQVLVAA